MDLIAALLATLLSGPTALPGEATRSIHPVPLMTDAPARCVSLPSGQGMSFVLDRDDLDAMIEAAPKRWTTEEERQAFIRARRARALLDAVEGTDALGCAVAGRPDSAYLVLHLGEQGRLRAWDAGVGAFVPLVERLEYNLDCRQGLFGTYTFRKPGGEEFFFLMSCIR
jgi:hypothetical protein